MGSFVHPWSYFQLRLELSSAIGRDCVLVLCGNSLREELLPVFKSLACLC
jgi:hypothetical protein